jgi:hypothetical protein
MRISELQTIKPKTPEQLRIASLKNQKAAIQRRIDTERGTQLMNKAQKKSL